MALYAFDGTNQRLRRKDGSSDPKVTNVGRFYRAYVEAEHEALGGEIDHSESGSIHLDGPGWTYMLTRNIPFPVTWVLGAAFGMGVPQRMREAYWRLCHNYKHGDRTVDIVGFSRGGALALTFANLVHLYGVCDPVPKLRSLRFLNRKYLGWGWHEPSRLGPVPEIRFIGLFDVVGSFGIPVNVLGIDFQGINLAVKLDLPEHLRARCFHAMALDETRRTFRPTRVDGAHEVWFRGSHPNIGGGLPERGLSDTVLRWMLDCADHLEPKPKRDVVELRELPRPGEPSNQAPQQYSIAKKFELMRGWFRRVRPGDLVHWSVFERPSLGERDLRRRAGREVSMLAPIPYDAVRYEEGGRRLPLSVECTE